MGRSLPALRTLNLVDNAVTHLRGYVGGILRRLPRVTTLDGCALDVGDDRRNQVAKIQRLVQDLGVTSDASPSPSISGDTVGTDSSPRSSSTSSPVAASSSSSSSSLSAAAADGQRTQFLLRSVRVSYGQSRASSQVSGRASGGGGSGSGGGGGGGGGSSSGASDPNTTTSLTSAVDGGLGAFYKQVRALGVKAGGHWDDCPVRGR